MADNPFDQFDAAEPPASGGNPFDSITDDTVARPKASDPPIIISAIGPHHSEKVNPTYTEQGFVSGDLHPDAQYHTSLSDADKKEYESFFKDPQKPPSAEFLRQWFHKKTGAYMGNADEIVSHFKDSGQYSTQQQFIIPTKANSAGGAYANHTANGLVFDFGPEVASIIDTFGGGGSDHPNVFNSDASFGNLLANNADLERAQLERDSADHPFASIGGELTGVAGNAILGNQAGLANLSRLSRAAAGVTEAGAYGAGAAGPGSRVEGAWTGAALGTATEVAAPIISKFIAATKAGDTAAAAEAAKAAHDLGIDLPRFVVGGEKDAARASALEQTIGGRKPISDATSKMLDQAEQARTGIASSVGTSGEPAAIGDEALNAAVGGVKAERKRIGAIYDQAKTAAGGTIFEASQTEKTLQQLADQEDQVLGGTKAGGVFKSLLEDLRQRQGKLTIDGARDTRSELRNRLRDEAGVTPDNADRLTNMIMDSMRSDIESGLADSGHTSAIPLYRKADAEWAKQRTLEDDVLRPFLGKNFDNWGEDVAKKINSDAKGNGTRLARFLSALPEDSANNVRASLIMRLGTSADGAQNAAGDAFSLDQFLTNWNQIKGARNLVFPKETVQSLDRLAKVAEAVKAAGRTKNRSNTGNVVSYLKSGVLPSLGAAETLLAHDPRGIALGILASAIGSVKQYGAAKLLASPAFARKLAATPLNAKGAVAFWSRPWVKAMASKNPAIAGEIQAFQSAFLSHANDNGIVSSAAASPDANGKDQ